MPLYGSLWAGQDFSMTMDNQTNVRGRRRWRRGSYPWITAGCRHRAGFWWILKLKLSWREVPSLQEHMELLQVGLLFANMFISWIEVGYQRWEMTASESQTHPQPKRSLWLIPPKTTASTGKVVSRNSWQYKRQDLPAARHSLKTNKELNERKIIES